MELWQWAKLRIGKTHKLYPVTTLLTYKETVGHLRGIGKKLGKVVKDNFN